MQGRCPGLVALILGQPGGPVDQPSERKAVYEFQGLLVPALRDQLSRLAVCQAPFVGLTGRKRRRRQEHTQPHTCDREARGATSSLQDGAVHGGPSFWPSAPPGSGRRVAGPLRPVVGRLLSRHTSSACICAVLARRSGAPLARVGRRRALPGAPRPAEKGLPTPLAGGMVGCLTRRNRDRFERRRETACLRFAREATRAWRRC